MLSIIVGTTSAIGTAITPSSPIGPFVATGVSDVSVAPMLCLILLMSAAEIFYASKNRHLSLSLNLAIMPLAVVLSAIAAINGMAVAP